MAASGVEVSEAIAYARRDGQALTGDLYRPEQGTGLPVLVAVHGGGWRMGNAERYRHWGRWLAGHGIALFAIRYTLARPGAPGYPAAVQDVGSAVRFLRANAGSHGLDPDRIGLMGDSAGAHLACMVALAGDEPRFVANQDPQGVSARVRAAVGVYGVYDLIAQWEHDQLARSSDQITEAFVGVSPIADRFRFHEASPLSYATMGAQRPAFMIAWGGDDDIVDWRSQSARFAEALKRANILVRQVPVAGAPHFWIDEPVDEPHSFTGFLAPRLLRFLQGQL